MGATARRNAKFQRETTHGWSSFVSDLCPHPRKCSELGHQIVRPRQALLGCLWVLTHLTVAASQPPPASHMHLDMWSANPCRVFTTDCVLQTAASALHSRVLEKPTGIHHSLLKSAPVTGPHFGGPDSPIRMIETAIPVRVRLRKHLAWWESLRSTDPWVFTTIKEGLHLSFTSKPSAGRRR